jgi:hypothetical protein
LVGQHNRLLASRHAEKGKNIRGKKTITDQENDEERDYEDLDDEGKDEEELSPQERKPLCTKVTGKAHGKKHKDSQGETPKQPQKNDQLAQTYKMEVEEPKVEDYLTQTACHLNNW